MCSEISKYHRIRVILPEDIIEIVDEDNKIVLKHDDVVLADVSNQESIVTIRNVISGNLNNKALLIGYCEVALITLVAYLVLSVFMLKRLEKLFNNINNGDTPFTLENVEHIKKIAYLMITLIILPYVGGTIFGILLNRNLDVSFELFSVVEILILFVISYIFEYGYEIQLDSKGKMYGDVNE